jgi:subtilisin family serine protease
MKKIKIAVGTLFFLALFSSCQNENLEQSEIENIVKPAELAGEKILGSYIILFNDDKSESSRMKMSTKVFSSRLEKSNAYKVIEGDAKFKIDRLLSNIKFDNSKVSNYYSTQFNGISVHHVSVDELKEFSKNPAVKAIYYDQIIPNPIDNIIKSPQNNIASRIAGQVTPCGITNAGGFVNGATSNAWIWIVDTGVDTDHPDLNVITDTRYAKSYIGTSVEDCNGHGTHVAGTAAAKNNTIGVVGVSAGAPIVPIRVFGCTGGASSSDILAAINHIGANDAPGDVVNMSLGGFFGANCSTTSPYLTALRGLGTSGTRVALAAGNDAADATLYSPACTNGTNIFTVASMTCEKTFSSFSNYNRSAVDVIATGSNVQSTWLNGGYNTISGTSMASPHVAGIMHARNGSPALSGSVTSRSQIYPIAVR